MTICWNVKAGKGTDRRKLFTSLQEVLPQVPLETLRRIVTYFTSPQDEHALDPSYEDTVDGYNPSRYRAAGIGDRHYLGGVNLLKPKALFSLQQCSVPNFLPISSQFPSPDSIRVRDAVDGLAVAVVVEDYPDYPTMRAGSGDGWRWSPDSRGLGDLGTSGFARCSDNGV